MTDAKTTTCSHDGCDIYTYLGNRSRRKWLCKEHAAEWPPASQPDQPESRLAEEDITNSGKRQSHALLIYSYIGQHHDRTGSEIAVGTGLSESQVHKRTSDLLNLGRIVKTGPRSCTVNRTLRSTWRIATQQLSLGPE